ncbi:MAG: apolipoprotein N-acyltransferase [Pseudomonadota bacterium]
MALSHKPITSFTHLQDCFSIFFAFVQKRRLWTSLICGAVSVLSLAPIYWWPVLFLTLPTLTYLLYDTLQNRTEFRKPILFSAFIGWCFGFGYFMAGLYWMASALLVEADKFAWAIPLTALLPASLALFYAMATALPAVLFKYVGKTPLISAPKKERYISIPLFILALSLSFAVLEWIRGHILTGFPWNSIGQGWAGNDYLLQSASLVGIHGLNFFTPLIFASPAVLFHTGQRHIKYKRDTLFFVGMMVFLVCAFIFGIIRLPANHSDNQRTFNKNVRLRLVQPNIPQYKKWDSKYRDWAIQKYLDLSHTNPAGQKDNLSSITHLIWPEVAWPVLMAQDPESLAKIAGLLPEGKHLITGSLRVETNDQAQRYYNSLIVFDDAAQVTSIYDKKHLVPFGEYLPLQSLLEAIGLKQLTRLKGGFTPGSQLRLMNAPGLPDFSPLICYEIVFPNKVIEHDARPKWLLNITNDAWFGATAGPHQHLHQARLRAVEEGLPVIRVANTGISAVISPYGMVSQSLPLESSGVIDTSLPSPLNPTLYAQQRDHLFFGILVLGAIFLIFGLHTYNR